MGSIHMPKNFVDDMNARIYEQISVEKRPIKNILSLKSCKKSLELLGQYLEYLWNIVQWTSL